jgi:hypothetical protein
MSMSRTLTSRAMGRSISAAGANVADPVETLTGRVKPARWWQHQDEQHQEGELPGPQPGHDARFMGVLL